MRSMHRAVLVAMLAVALLLGISASALAVGSITGTVRDFTERTPIADITVRAYLWDGDYEPSDTNPSAEATTAADGTYVLPNLVAGEYQIVFSDSDNVYRDHVNGAWGLPPYWVMSSFGVEDGEAVTADTWMFTEAQVNEHRAPRVSGSNIYQSAMQAAVYGFGKADTIVVVGGAAWADALSASTLAGYYNAPILFTPSAALPSGFVAAARSLEATKAIVVGGTASVSGNVVKQLNAAGIKVQARVYGSDRYQTAAQVIRHLRYKGARLDPEAFVVSGEKWPDAVAAAPLASRWGMPVLLVNRYGAPKATVSIARELGTDEVWVVGGQSSVSDAAIRSLAAANSEGLWVSRTAGRDRFETAAKMARVLPVDNMSVANGFTFHEALTGGIVSGVHGGALVLTPATSLNGYARAAINANKLFLWEAALFGRTGQLSDGVRRAVRTTIGTEFLQLDDPMQVTALEKLQESASAFEKARKAMPREHVTN